MTNFTKRINKQWKVIALQQLTSHMTMNASFTKGNRVCFQLECHWLCALSVSHLFSIRVSLVMCTITCFQIQCHWLCALSHLFSIRVSLVGIGYVHYHICFQIECHWLCAISHVFSIRVSLLSLVMCTITLAFN